MDVNAIIQQLTAAANALRQHAEEDLAAQLEQASQWLQQNAQNINPQPTPQPSPQQTPGQPATGDQGVAGQATPAQGQTPQGGQSA